MYDNDICSEKKVKLRLMTNEDMKTIDHCVCKKWYYVLDFFSILYKNPLHL